MLVVVVFLIVDSGIWLSAMLLECSVWVTLVVVLCVAGSDSGSDSGS